MPDIVDSDILMIGDSYIDEDIIAYPMDDSLYDALGLGIFHATRTRGVFCAEENLSVKAGGDMSILVSSGLAWLIKELFWGVSVLVRNARTLTSDPADGMFSRFDIVCLRINKNKNKPELVLKKADYAKVPSLDELPLPERNLNFDEIYLAAALIRAGAKEILDTDIYDLRADERYCGLMSSGDNKIPTEQLYLQFKSFMDKIAEQLDRLNAGVETMTVTRYDGNGEAGEHGGIVPTAMTVNSASAEVKSSVLEIKSVFTRNTDCYTVEFDMPAGYEGGAVTIDGSPTNILGLDGEPATLDLVGGFPTVLVRRGDKAFFRMGGGRTLLDLNTITVASFLTLPGTAKDGTIAFITTLKISDFYIQPTLPNLADSSVGDIVIQTNSTYYSRKLNGLKKGALEICVARYFQHTGTEWRLLPCWYRVNGSWIPHKTYILQNGTQINLNGSAGWSVSVVQNGFNESTASYLRVRTKGNDGGGYIWSSIFPTIGFSSYVADIDYSMYLGSSNDLNVYEWVKGARIQRHFNTWRGLARQEMTYDISKFTADAGLAQMNMYIYSYNGQSSGMNIYNAYIY